jgi:flagellar motor switch/type III secretory pathway protein FliN
VIAELRVFRDPDDDNPDVHRVIFEPRLSVARERLEQFATASSERLSELFGKEIRTRASEPRNGAMDFDPNVIRGSIAFAIEAQQRNAILLLSEEHARRLAAYAFSEKSPAPKVGLSVIEERLVERVVRELSTLCTPFTGPQEKINVATIDDVMACTTHFILRIGSPMDVAILVGLTEEEEPPQGPPIDPQMLRDVTVTANVEFASAILKASQIAALRIGSVIEFSTSLDDAAFLRIDSTTIASGACGMCDGRPAFFVQQQHLPALY